jgi:hypothetical protein
MSGHPRLAESPGTTARPAHRVETLRLELGHRNEREARGAHELHDRLMRFLRRDGLAAIEDCFDGACPPGEVWVLPRLTLDLGVLDRNQDERQWLERLTRSLKAELARAALQQDAPVHPPIAITRGDGERHEVDQFLHYLRHGHLPWGLTLSGRRALSGWLARLAHRQGAALWRALQQDPARDRLLARLSRITPHDGLQALVAQRDPRLAATLQQLDDEVLLPLQGRGRLSAYQRGRLQQALRVAALEQLWDARGAGLGGHGRRALLGTWRALLADALGGGWRGDLAALAGGGRSDTGGNGSSVGRGGGAGRHGGRGFGAGGFGGFHGSAGPDGIGGMGGALGAAPRAGSLVALLVGGRTGATDVAALPDTVAASPGRTWEQALIQLQGLLRQRRPGQGDRLRRMLTQLAASHPMLLRRRLRAWAMQRRERRTWSLALEPASMALLLGAMSPRPAPELAASAGQHWAESLRQTALRLHREAPATHRPGLSRLQALLMQASLRHLAEGKRPPDQHSGWLALWRNAWLDWDDADDPPPMSSRGKPASTSAPSSSALGPDDRPPPPRRRGAGATDATDDALLHLERACHEGRWRWPQRLRLARLLETAQGCDRWLHLLTEDRRWRMLQAQFGAMTGPLRQRAARLEGWLRGLVREPAAALAEHWRRLCRHLFIRGLSPDAASLRRHYQDEAVPRALGAPGAADALADSDGPVATRDTSARPARRPDEREPVWVDDAGQVLLAAYAERLFKHLDLVRDGRFVDDAARAAGVQCLQALCHGPEPAPPDESCTALSRLLCGVGSDTVLPLPAPLDDERATLLEQLLSAVIAHWSAVGRTSVAGLRESFLQRQGRLHEERVPAGEARRWRLRVQTRGFDVLLDRLPWSFHTIRLPWMQGALHVEWR